MSSREQGDEFLFYSLSMIGSKVGRERYEQLAERNRQRREQREQEKAERQSKQSEVRRFDGDEGTCWDYVVMDGHEIHLKKCSTSVEVLRIPEQIAGLPVVCLQEGSCAHLDSVREIIIAPCVHRIEDRAFQFNPNLRSVSFPDAMASFTPKMFQGCPEIKRLRLPGMLEEIDGRLFELSRLETLFIGAGTRSIKPGAFAKSPLECLEIDEGNPYIATDGIGIYDHDFTKLLALARPVASYEVRATCRMIGNAAFSWMASVEEVTLPRNIEVIEEQGLAKTAIASFVAPSGLKEIGERAFFNCVRLDSVKLNEGLRFLGLDAFKGTKIIQLEIPASVQELEAPLLSAPTEAEGIPCSLTLAPDSPYYLIDEAGGLYRKTAEGLVFQHLFNDALTTYRVLDGTIATAPESFAQRKIEQVILPDSLTAIGNGSFRGCKGLTTVNLPAQLEEIGENAFLDTSIESVCLPSTLEALGSCALVSIGAHNGRVEPSLGNISVEDGNPRFFMEGGLLMERKDSGRLKVVLYVGPESIVRIPLEVDEIASYAFNGATKIRELYLSDRIEKVGMRGLAIKENLQRLQIELTEPLEGHDLIDMDLPQTHRCYQQMNNVLGFAEPLDPALLFDGYDGILLNATSAGQESEQSMDLYERAARIIERLKDPFLMSPVSKKLASSFIERHLKEVCDQAARHDDRRLFEDLLELGSINAQTIDSVIDGLVGLQDASIMGYLLEEQRLRFGGTALDFQL